MHFLKACLPGIREKLPDVRLLVAGTICDVLKPDLPGVKLLGKVENVESAYRDAALVINPVRAGTGLKIKTIEALAFGRALVTTPSGADGLEAWEGNAFLVARDDSQFASTVVELLTNRAKLESLAASGPSFVKRWNEMQLEALQSILSIRDGQLR
jgi:glycosyltransferase involved in cell wall biosynthesis